MDLDDTVRREFSFMGRSVNGERDAIPSSVSNRRKRERERVAGEAAISGRAARILRAHARHIQRLGRRAVGDIVEIGRRLTDAKRRVGHGKFLCWLAAEFGWSERHAQNFMSVYELASKSEKFADLDLPVSALYLLAAPSTPDAAIEAVAERVGTGAGLSVAQVKDIIARSRRASPLRHVLGLAKQIMSEVLNAGAQSIVDDRLAEFQRAGHNCEWIKYVLWHKCGEAAAKCEAQIDRLQREIALLRQVRHDIGSPDACSATPAAEEKARRSATGRPPARWVRPRLPRPRSRRLPNARLLRPAARQGKTKPYPAQRGQEAVPEAPEGQETG